MKRAYENNQLDLFDLRIPESPSHRGVLDDHICSLVALCNLPPEIKWLTSGDYAVSETIDFGELELYGLYVWLSGYACRTGDDLRFFGNYRINQGDEVLSDQRGLDVESFAQLLMFATRSAAQFSRNPEGSFLARGTVKAQ